MKVYYGEKNKFEIGERYEYPDFAVVYEKKVEEDIPIGNRIHKSEKNYYKVIDLEGSEQEIMGSPGFGILSPVKFKVKDMKFVFWWWEGRLERRESQREKKCHKNVRSGLKNVK